MTALLRRTPLAGLLRQPHAPRRTRPPGYRPEHRVTSGPRRRCRLGHACPCRARYTPGIALAAPVLAATLLLPTIRGGR